MKSLIRMIIKNKLNVSDVEIVNSQVKFGQIYILCEVK